MSADTERRRPRVPRLCWHCGRRLSNMNCPDGTPYWYAPLEIEPGKTVRVHKCCLNDARESVRKLTARTEGDK
jgi:hypothetical protein